MFDVAKLLLKKANKQQKYETELYRKIRTHQNWNHNNILYSEA